VLLGNVDGSLSARRDYVCGRIPFSATTGDLDGDGARDVVTANWDESNVSIFYGNGDGTLRQGVSLDAAGNVLNVAIGDLNGDSRPDLAAMSDYGYVSVLLNGGGRSFGAKADYPLISRYLALGDLNRDGILDLAG